MRPPDEQVDASAALVDAVTTVALVNLPLVAWHLSVLSRMHPGTITGGFVGGIMLLNLFPVLGALALWTTTANKIAGWLCLIPLGIGLVVGGYSHFLSPGPANVFRTARGPLSGQLQAGALLLLVIDALGCWLAWRLVRPHRRRLVSSM
jgi:hypothetical protein